MEDSIYTECGYEWSMESDEEGLFNGYGCHHVQIVVQGEVFHLNDYGDFICNICGNRFRRYGDGGLCLGIIPWCPKCGGNTSEI